MQRVPAEAAVPPMSKPGDRRASHLFWHRNIKKGAQMHKGESPNVGAVTARRPGRPWRFQENKRKQNEVSGRPASPFRWRRLQILRESTSSRTSAQLSRQCGS